MKLYLKEVDEFEQDYQQTLQRFADASDQLTRLNSKLDSLVSKIHAGEFDKVDAPIKAAAYARIRVAVDEYTRKLTANLKAATAHAQQAKSNAFQAMVLGGLIFKFLFGKKKVEPSSEGSE